MQSFDQIKIEMKLLLIKKEQKLVLMQNLQVIFKMNSDRLFMIIMLKQMMFHLEKLINQSSFSGHQIPINQQNKRWYMLQEKKHQRRS
ncbi:unnamed protein product [Paramecium sonneborni]|uniref:Uncharacterized protein n=1 Tax=Paramecium sonneborni TaxID=65129 RepID=A0A8S1RMZ1_9CILI|nr:unnamed protein product [Paramecium sonneborni]